MAVLRAALCAVLIVTVARSKPVCLSDGEDSKSSESDSSEENAAPVGSSQEPLQPAFTEADMPDAVEETDPPGTAGPLPSAAASPSPALPGPDDPQTSADAEALQLMPDDPSQTALGIHICQDMPGSGPSQGSASAGTVQVPPEAEVPLHRHPGLKETHGNRPQATATTHQGFPQGPASPLLPHVVKPTPTPFSTAAPLPIPIGTVQTGVPVCFTFQFTPPEPEPPRGDSI